MTYTTASLVEAELGIAAANSFSTSTIPTLAQVNEWIDETDAYIDQMAGFTAASTARTVTVDYDGSGVIYVKDAPIISTTSFKYSQYSIGTTEYPDWQTKTENTHFYTKDDRGEYHIISGQFSPSGGTKNIQIVYTSGYSTTPKTHQMLSTKLVAKRTIDLVMEKDLQQKQSGKTTSVGSITIQKSAAFGVQGYKALQSDIKELEDKIIKGDGVYRYQSY